MKKYSAALRVALGLTILIILLYRIGIQQIISILKSFNSLYLIPIIILFLCLLLIGAFNFWILLMALKERIGYFKILNHSLTSWALGLLMPGKLGEFSIIYLLKKENIGLGTGAAIAILDKTITILGLFSIGIFGFFVFFPKNLAIKLIVIIFLLIFFSLVVLISNFGRRIIKILIGRYSKKFVGFHSNLIHLIKDNKKILFSNYLLTVFKWGVSFSLIYLIFLGLNVKIPFLHIAMIGAIVQLISFIPLSISGLGVREISYVYFYSLIGIEPSYVVSMSLISLALTYIVAAIIFFKIK